MLLLITCNTEKVLEYKLLSNFVLNATLKLDGQDIGPRNIILLLVSFKTSCSFDIVWLNDRKYIRVAIVVNTEFNLYLPLLTNVSKDCLSTKVPTVYLFKISIVRIFLYNRVQRRTQKLQYATGFLKIAVLQNVAVIAFFSSTHVISFATSAHDPAI